MPAPKSKPNILFVTTGDHRRLCPICKRNVPTAKGCYIDHLQLGTLLRCPNSGKAIAP